MSVHLDKEDANAASVDEQDAFDEWERSQGVTHWRPVTVHGEGTTIEPCGCEIPCPDAIDAKTVTSFPPPLGPKWRGQ